MKNYQNHIIDYMSKTITLSKSFYEKACNINNTTEFEEMKKLRTEFPDFTFTVKQIRKKTGKTTYRNLTYDNMERYIRANEKNPAVMLSKFQTVKESSYVQASRYAYVKKWFLEQYPDYTESKTEQEANGETVKETNEISWNHSEQKGKVA